MRNMLCVVLALFLACAGARGRSATRSWDGGSASIPVVQVESVDPSFEIVMTSRHGGIEIPMVRHGLNSYGRVNLTVWIRNTSRSQEMVEIKAKFFDASGGIVDAAADWTQVFVGPGEAKQVELLCAEDGATTFKVLLR